MRKSGPVLLFSLSSLLPLFSQEPTPPVVLKAPGVSDVAMQEVDPPRIDISPKGRVNAGDIGPREKKEIHYTFHNTSKAPISLRLMDTTPHTTVYGTALLAPIPADGKAQMTMLLDGADTVGYQRRNAKFVTDDPKQGHYMLPVEVEVRPDLKVDAERKSFGNVIPHESPELVFKFVRETGDPLSVKLTSQLPAYMEGDVEPGKSTAELRLKLRPALVSPGTRRGLETVKVSSNAPLQPDFTLYVDWTLKPLIEAEPARVVFLDPKQAVKTLKLRADKGKPFRIMGAKVLGDGFQVATVPLSLAEEHSLEVTRTAPKECKAMLELRFEGNENLLQVPLSYLPPVPPKPLPKKK